MKTPTLHTGAVTREPGIPSTQDHQSGANSELPCVVEEAQIAAPPFEQSSRSTCSTLVHFSVGNEGAAKSPTYLPSTLHVAQRRETDVVKGVVGHVVPTEVGPAVLERPERQRVKLYISSHKMTRGNRWDCTTHTNRAWDN